MLQNIVPARPTIILPNKAFWMEKVRFPTLWEIWRYRNHDDFMASREDGNPFNFCLDYSDFKNNLLLNEGAEAIWDKLTGLGTPAIFSNANARIGVADSTTAEADTQTGLQGGTTAFKAMDTSFPVKSGTGNDTIEFQSVFGSADANQAWNEFTVDNGATVNLNRKVSAQGTKSSGQTWTIKVSIQGI
jgi:hypothetical protein